MPSQDSKKSYRKIALVNWLRYSGASVTVTINPWHWRLVPWAQTGTLDVWAGPRERSCAVSWLFLTLRIWLDDGSW